MFYIHFNLNGSPKIKKFEFETTVNDDKIN